MDEKQDFIISDYGEEEQRQEKSEKASNLMFCPDCGNEVSKLANSCPKCGRPIIREKEKKKNGFVKAVCYFVCVGGLFGVCGFIGPLLCGIAVAIYCAFQDKQKYDISYFKKVAAECLIFSIVLLAMSFVIFGIRKTKLSIEQYKINYGIQDIFTDPTQDLLDDMEHGYDYE